ncbi:uncharacterized protein DDB_G0283697-like [Tigriopus californicus]|uniref:uncharacterized protein DDB_G0283697-like n=1 Tax=Tigriopus californicus TaxID=6832 RepID=UPI0027DA8483|nr:uncharacterized protein DDB_G0283697-like [Tigriopus californicus]
MSDTDYSLSLSDEDASEELRALQAQPSKVSTISVNIPDSASRRRSSAISISEEIPLVNVSPRIVISPGSRGTPKAFSHMSSRRRRPSEDKKGSKKTPGDRTVIETKTYRLSFPSNMDINRVPTSPERLSVHDPRKTKKKKRKQRLRRSKSASSESSSSSESDSEMESKVANVKRRRSKRGKRKSTKRKKRAKQTVENIEVENVMILSDANADQSQGLEDFQPPRNLSPRSAAEYARKVLKHAAEKRRKKKKRKDKDGKDKKTQKRKRRRKRQKGKNDDSEAEDEEEPPPKPKESQNHFYQTPRQLYKKRCVFVSENKPVKCSICKGMHYRTKRNFASNLRIIANVNRTFGRILGEMRNKMRKIDSNLIKVKKNLEYLEEMYEGVFRKVNRLIA